MSTTKLSTRVCKGGAIAQAQGSKERKFAPCPLCGKLVRVCKSGRTWNHSPGKGVAGVSSAQ